MAKAKKKGKPPPRGPMARLDQVNRLINAYCTVSYGFPTVDVLNAVMLFTADLILNQTKVESRGPLVDRYTDFLVERIAELAAEDADHG
jgi:hypothetical protein